MRAALLLGWLLVYLPAGAQDAKVLSLPSRTLCETVRAVLTQRGAWTAPCFDDLTWPSLP